MNGKPDDAAAAERERTEKKLALISEYAWNWFSYHAGQRTNMFNYSLAAAAILAAGYGAVLDKSPKVAGVIGLVGFVVTLSFVLLDKRNQRLVEYGEGVLKSVESILFADVEGSQLKKHGMPAGILRVDTKDKSWRKDFWAGKHRVHLRLVEGVLALTFFVGGAAALFRPEWLHATDAGTATAIEHVAVSVETAAENLKFIGDKLSSENANPQAPRQ